MTAAAKHEIKSTVIAVAGALIYALGINLFIVPLGFYSGGFLGVGQIIRTLLIDYLNLPFKNIDIAGIIYYIINIPLFIMAYKAISRKFFIKTVLCVTAQTVFMTFIKVPSDLFAIDSLTGAVIGGIISGFGVGLMLTEGASGGGQDILGVYMSRKSSKMSVGKIAIIINAAVFAVCSLLFDVTVVIYSLIFVVISSLITDRCHEQNILVEAFIITDKTDIIEEITKRCDRTATIIEGKGAYSGRKYNVVYTVISKYEAISLSEFVKRHDKNAFVTFSSVDSVCGNFQKRLG